MRILTLELERYGSFTDRSFPLNPDARLHVIHGLNAAGKSCALAGITDLFFGIEAQTRYAFLHEAKAMRLGATLQARNLSVLSFKRRKGNKGVLFSHDGKPLEDNVLLPFLGGLTRSVFCHAFGLNSEQLREGAEEMLDSEGEVGATLYAAASGLSGITRLRRQLEEEAAKIFKPGRGSDKRRFDQAADAYTQARLEIRKRTLRAETLESMRAQLESLTSRLTALNQERNSKRKEHARLTRLRTIAPQLRTLDAECECLAGFADLPELSEQALTRLRDAIADSETLNQKAESAAESLAVAGAALNEITVESDILVHQASVQALQTNIGKYQSAMQDRARVASDADGKQREIVQMAARVGIPQDRLDSAQPTDSALAEIEDLIGKGLKLGQGRDTFENSITEAKKKIEDMENAADGSALPNPAAWQTRLDALVSSRSLLDRHRTLVRDCASTRRKLEERTARLSPPAPELERLAMCSFPSAEDLGRFGKRFAKLDEQSRQFEAELKSLNASIEQTQQRLEVLASGEPVASAERIADARRTREESWFQLRPIILGEDTNTEATARPVIVDLYEVRVTEADRLADSATRDADRVAQYNTELTLLAQKQAHRSQVEDHRSEAALSFGQASEEWLELWAPITSSPTTPGEMTSWIDALRLLLEQREALVADEATLAALEPQISELHAALEALGREIGLENHIAIPTDNLFSLLDKHLKDRAVAWNKKAINQGLVADAHKQLGRLEGSLAAHVTKETSWSDSWRVVISTLGFEAGASLTAVAAAVKVWRELPSRRLSLEGEMKRVRGMDRDIREFEQEVTRLTQIIAADLPPLPPADQATRLRDIVARQVRQQLLHSAAKSRVEKGSSNLEAATRDAELAAKLIRIRMAELALLGEPTPTLERLERAAAIRSNINALRSTLVAQSDGIPEDQLRADLAGFDSEAVLNAIGLLAQGFPLLDEEINEVFAEKAACEKSLTDAESGTGAELALQQLKSAEVEMDLAAREYLTLALSTKMLNRVIEEHRTAQSAPFMQLAGSLFQNLTSGAFTHIDQEFDPDSDRPQLVGVRDNGKTVGIDGMSDGQRDQLYLALRLAYLDDYAAKSEPVPFIGDDIFTTFDEPSTRAGLLALADIGSRVQPILFTHHRFVVDLAMEALGDQVNVISL